MNTPSSSCAYDFRRENLFGEDYSDKVEIGPRNSVVGRLQAAVSLAASKAPGLRFDSYLDGASIR